MIRTANPAMVEDPAHRRGAHPRDQLACPLARLGVDGEQVLEMPRPRGRERIERPLDDLRDRRERDAAVENALHRHLVGGVQHARRRTPRLPGLARQPQAREGVQVGRLEGELTDLGKVEVGRSTSARSG